MDTIAMHPEGILSYRGKALASDPLRYLGFKVVIAPGCTLRAFFRMLAKHSELIRVNPFGASFMAHYGTCPSQGCSVGGVGQLELSRTVEMIGYPGSPSMQIFVSLEGKCGQRICDIKPYDLENLLDLPLVLGCLHHRVFGDKMDTFDFETGFTLFELIDGICWQLSFHNLPQQCRLDL